MDQVPRNPLVQLRARSNTLSISEGRSVFATGLDGFIDDGEHGLFVHETRVLSRYRILVDGQLPKPVALSNVEQNSWFGYYVVKTKAHGGHSEIDLGSGQVNPETQQTLELTVTRYLSGGIHEDIDLGNFTGRDLSFQLAIELDADFADQFETTFRRIQKGRMHRQWHEDDSTLSFSYEVHRAFHEQDEIGTAHFEAAAEYAFANSTTPARFENGKVIFDVSLPANGTWHTCLLTATEVGGDRALPSENCHNSVGGESHEEQLKKSFLVDSTEFKVPSSPGLSHTVVRALNQAKADLASLRLYDLDTNDNAWTFAAGAPIYLALFGRDTLTAAWQAGTLGPEVMVGTLDTIARFQGTEVNDWRDEQPGKMLHEAHTGPLSALNFFPRARYYGSSTTSILYPFLVAELWHWTGNKALIEPYIEPALKALQWADRYGDLDGDGFYEYLSRSKRGTRHQGWKDSSDAIVTETGADVPPPVAMAEEQAFAYVSKLHFSETLWWLGRIEEAKKLFHQASELKKRFNDKFWIEDLGFFAMGLDKDKRQIRSLGSDAGHCLATGIADKHLVNRVADRLMSDELFSGWGVRTLSKDHPAYNPYSYHRGSVWPVENGTFAIGFTRFGLKDHMERLCRSVFEACQVFEFARLPELFSGHERSRRYPFPALYPRANSPQAWSSSVVFNLVQSMLGLYPYAPLNTLIVDPQLPEWLPSIELHRLRVAGAEVSLRFWRSPSGLSHYKILDLKGKLHVVRQPNPWSLTATAGERVADAVETITSLL